MTLPEAQQQKTKTEEVLNDARAKVLDAQENLEVAQESLYQAESAWNEWYWRVKRLARSEPVAE